MRAWFIFKFVYLTCGSNFMEGRTHGVYQDTREQRKKVLGGKDQGHGGKKDFDWHVGNETRTICLRGTGEGWCGLGLPGEPIAIRDVAVSLARYESDREVWRRISWKGGVLSLTDDIRVVG